MGGTSMHFHHVHKVVAATTLQVHSSTKGLRLITFDADGTLYADGCHMEHDNEMVSAPNSASLFTRSSTLPKSGVHMCIPAALRSDWRPGLVRQ